MIEPPLWDLMLSTQETQPGSPDPVTTFKMTPGRIQTWVDMVGEDVTCHALDQLDELLSYARLDYKSLAMQTGIPFASEAEARDWLGKWWDLLVATID